MTNRSAAIDPYPDGVRSLGRSVSEERPTLEVRWIYPGALEAVMIDRFAPYVDVVEAREDTYLVGHGIHGLSVKIRGQAQLDIKVASGNHADLDVPRRARGRVQSWKKWSFPLRFDAGDTVAHADRVRVEKVRRIGRFSFGNGAPAARGAPSHGGLTTCAVELTEVAKGGAPWWTIGLEVAGDLLATRKAIEATAALVFSDPLPGELELSMADSKSYAEWLHLRDPGLTPTLF